MFIKRIKNYIGKHKQHLIISCEKREPQDNSHAVIVTRQWTSEVRENITRSTEIMLLKSWILLNLSLSHQASLAIILYHKVGTNSSTIDKKAVCCIQRMAIWIFQLSNLHCDTCRCHTFFCMLAKMKGYSLLFLLWTTRDNYMHLWALGKFCGCSA